MERAALRVIISGRVQGVFFRAFVLEKASELQLSGYVRNLPSGQVEVKAEGAKSDLEKLLGFLKMGPPAARVTALKTQWSKYTGEITNFSISC